VLERLREGSVDVVTFTSGAIADAFVSAVRDAGLDVDDLMERVVIASIGPVTSRELLALGYDEDVEAEKQTMASLAEAIADCFTPE
jgi:uroporphyrinogen III methyltransferase / synthase